MPQKRTIDRARRDKREGKAPSTQAGEFVREEIEHVREGKHGARSTRQAIAIGLSKARRAGVDLPPPAKGSAKTRKSAASAYRKGQRGEPISRKRSRARVKALKGFKTRAAQRGFAHGAFAAGAIGFKNARGGFKVGFGAQGGADAVAEVAKAVKYLGNAEHRTPNAEHRSSSSLSVHLTS